MKTLLKAVCLILGVVLSGAVAHAAEPYKDHDPASVPWARIEAGLTQLADGDAKAAAASFRAARYTDPTGLAELLSELTTAYATDDRKLLGVAGQRFHRNPVVPAVVEEALARVRQDLKGEASPSLLHPLLCNLRLLSGDRATDGEPVLEIDGASADTGLLIRPRPLFTPGPRLSEAAKQSRDGDTLMIDVELTLDSEGCPAAMKLLQPGPGALVNQTLASLEWWAYEPASYDGHAVGWKLPVHLDLRFVPSVP